MVETKKKKYIIFRIFIAIALIISVKIIYKDKLYHKIHSCKKYYRSNWTLEQRSADLWEENTIDISFSMKFSLKDYDYDDVLNSISKTCDAIVYTFLEDPKSQYKNYNLQIVFNDIDVNFIIYVDGNNQSIDIYNDFYDLSIADIATYFPETEALTFFRFNNVDIEEIVGFTDLKEISIGRKLTEEEKEYIKSIFPDCYIDPSYYEDGVYYSGDEEEWLWKL